MTGSRFLQPKPGYQQIQVAPARPAPIAARAALSKFAGVVAHHAPALSRFAAKVAAHVHLPHLHHVPHVPHALLELPGQLWRKVRGKPPAEKACVQPCTHPADRPAKPKELQERRLKPRFNKPSGPAP